MENWEFSSVIQKYPTLSRVLSGQLLSQISAPTLCTIYFAGIFTLVLVKTALTRKTESDFSNPMCSPNFEKLKENTIFDCQPS